MKHSERILDKINNLLNVNYEAEKIYSEIYKSVSNDSMKKFFRERLNKRREFNRELVNEFDKHSIVPKSASLLNNYFNKLQKKEIDQEVSDNGDRLLFEVFRSTKESINKYDELLMEFSLPLSLCRALVKQRDDIQTTIQVLARDEAFAY